VGAKCKSTNFAVVLSVGLREFAAEVANYFYVRRDTPPKASHRLIKSLPNGEADVEEFNGDDIHGTQRRWKRYQRSSRSVADFGL
jgi:hypothetical protein